MIEEDEFEKEVEDLTAMLRSLRLIQDKVSHHRFERDVRTSFQQLLRKLKND